MSLGFAQGGAKPSFAADIDEDACATYRENLSVNAVQVDISRGERSFHKRLDDFRGVFALIGGPPCQGFSSAGKKSAKDHRNKLIFEYIEIVERISPRWFLFENVEGLLTSIDGKSIRDLAKEFIQLGYRIRLEKLNFASYGLPQGRKRIILIGNRFGMDFVFPVATHSFNAGKHKSVSNLPFAPSFDAALAGLGTATTEWDVRVPYATRTPMSPYDELMRAGNAVEGVTHHVANVPAQYADAIARLRPGETMKDLPTEYWHDSFQRRAFRRVMDGTPTERRGGLCSPTVAYSFGNPRRVAPRLEQLHRQPSLPGDRRVPPGRAGQPSRSRSRSRTRCSPRTASQRPSILRKARASAATTALRPAASPKCSSSSRPMPACSAVMTAV